MRPHAAQANDFDSDERKGWMFFESSTLCCARFDAEMKELRIHFVSGGTYTYFEVPRTVVRQMLLAPSAGRYFHKHIKSAFDYAKEEK